MRTILLVIIVAALAAASVPHFVHAGDQPRCAECGMMVDESSRFSARLVAGGKTLHFCDIGDLLVHLRDKKIDPAAAQVRDHRTGALIDASRARYVHAPKRFSTPMGWSIAAFQDAASAAEYGPSLDITAMMRELK